MNNLTKVVLIGTALSTLATAKFHP